MTAADEGATESSPKRGRQRSSGSRPSSAETRQRIIVATIQTLNAEGMMGTSARSIARTGGFNQALIYYHFDSLEDLFFEVIQDVNERRFLHFGKRLDEVKTLGELVEVAIDLHHGVPDSDDNSAVALLVAGWSPASGLGPKVLASLKPWDDAVSAAMQRILRQSSLPELVPVDDLAHAVSAVFLGLHLLSRLDREDSQTDQVFESLAGGANAVTLLLNAFPKPPEKPPK